MLKDGTFYNDLGPDHFDRHSKASATKRLVAKLVSLGYEVSLKPVTA